MSNTHKIPMGELTQTVYDNMKKSIDEYERRIRVYEQNQNNSLTDSDHDFFKKEIEKLKPHIEKQKESIKNLDDLYVKI